MAFDLFTLDCECGCAAKIPAGSLSCILSNLDLPTSPALLVGAETLDDAGVYQISDDQCLVQTVDFFPPVARAPYVYGQIAAANSLSDIYAMGGKPLTALAVVCFPAESLGPDVLEEITKGAVEKLREAGAVLLGGHSIVDPQPKYGLAVTGVVRPDCIMDNAHAMPGDLLLLTKPLGTGVTIMAAKAGMAGREQEETANKYMATLNREAAEIALECGTASCTDITGFGLLGHAMQMAKASGVSMEIWTDCVPQLNGALDFASTGLLSGAAYANRKYVGDNVHFVEDVTLAEQDLLFDPQTSGGLLLCCPENEAARLLKLAEKRLSTPHAVVGRIVPKEDGALIRVAKSQ